MSYILKILLILSLFISGCFQKKDTILKIGNSVEPSTLDPQLAPGLSEAKVATAIFEGLLVPDSRTLKPLPGMAESYTISPDGLEYTFFLRDSIFWSNGDPVVAQDFIDALQRGLSSSIVSPWIELYFVIKNARSYYNHEITAFSQVGAEALSPKVLKFTLEQPIDFFLSLLTHWAWMPVNRKNIEKFGDFLDRNNHWTKAENIVSNGPYLLESVEIGGKIVLAKNKQYWDAENVKIDRVHIISGIDASTEENMFVAGQLDITDNVPSDKIELYRKQKTLQSSASLGSFFYWLNCKKRPFDDVRVRKAFSLAIDRHAIGNLRNRGTGFEAYSLVPMGTMNYSHQNLFQSNVDLARQLLAEAGYPNGENFPEITILINTSDNFRIISEAIQEMLRKILNINVHLHNIEWGVFLAKRRSHEFDMCRGGWIGDFNDPITFLNLFLSKDNNNHAQWVNEEYDRLIFQASQGKPFHERSEILAKAEALMIDEMPIIPIYFDSICHLVSTRIRGWYPNILDCHPLKYVEFQN